MQAIPAGAGRGGRSSDASRPGDRGDADLPVHRARRSRCSVGTEVVWSTGTPSSTPSPSARPTAPMTAFRRPSGLPAAPRSAIPSTGPAPFATSATGTASCAANPRRPHSPTESPDHVPAVQAVHRRRDHRGRPLARRRPAAAQTAASDLRTALNTTLAEHVYLAAAATAAALGGRGGEFKDAAGALDANSVALSQAIGSVYGDGAESAFLALWRKHIGFFVDYTTAWRRRTGDAGQGREGPDRLRRRLRRLPGLRQPQPPKEVVAGSGDVTTSWVSRPWWTPRPRATGRPPTPGCARRRVTCR